MLISSILFLLSSNAVTQRRDKSIYHVQHGINYVIFALFYLIPSLICILPGIMYSIQHIYSSIYNISDQDLNLFTELLTLLVVLSTPLVILQIFILIVIMLWEYTHCFFLGFLNDIWKGETDTTNKLFKDARPPRFAPFFVSALLLILILLSSNYNLNFEIYKIYNFKITIGLCYLILCSLVCLFYISLSGSALKAYVKSFANFPILCYMYTNNTRNGYLKGQNFYTDVSKEILTEFRKEFKKDKSNLTQRETEKINRKIYFFGLGLFFRMVFFRIPGQIVQMIISLLPLFVFITIILFYIKDINYGNEKYDLLSILLKQGNISSITKFDDYIRLIISLLTNARRILLSLLNIPTTLVHEEVSEYLSNTKNVFHEFKAAAIENYIDQAKNYIHNNPYLCKAMATVTAIRLLFQGYNETRNIIYFFINSSDRILNIYDRILNIFYCIIYYFIFPY